MVRHQFVRFYSVVLFLEPRKEQPLERKRRKNPRIEIIVTRELSIQEKSVGGNEVLEARHIYIMNALWHNDYRVCWSKLR